MTQNCTCFALPVTVHVLHSYDDMIGKGLRLHLGTDASCGGRTGQHPHILYFWIPLYSHNLTSGQLTAPPNESFRC